MNKKTRYLIFILLIATLTNCSFDKKTGIWSGGENEKKRILELEKKQKEEISVVKIFSSEDFFSEEILSTKAHRLEK